MHSAVCKMDHQQGPAVPHMELRSVSRGSIDGRGVWGRANSMCMYLQVPSLFTQNCHSIINLLYPKQNKKFKRIKIKVLLGIF